MRDGAPAKNKDRVNPLQGGDHVGPVSSRDERSSWAAQHPRRSVVIDRDDEIVPESARSAQIPDVTDMQKVEQPVGEDDPWSRSPAFQRCDAPGQVAHREEAALHAGSGCRSKWGSVLTA